jgi:hypothetical protein
MRAKVKAVGKKSRRRGSSQAIQNKIQRRNTYNDIQDTDN